MKYIELQLNPAITDFKGPEYFIRYCRIPLLPIWLCFEKKILSNEDVFAPCLTTSFAMKNQVLFIFGEAIVFFHFLFFFLREEEEVSCRVHATVIACTQLLSRARNCYCVHATVIACTQRLSKFLKLFRQIRITAGLILSSTRFCWEKNPCLFFCSLVNWECRPQSQLTPWFRTSQNRDVGIEPLARPLTRSLASLTHSLAPHCPLWSHTLLRMFARSFAPELVGQLNNKVQFSGCSE